MVIRAPLYTVDDLDEFPRDGNRYEVEVLSPSSCVYDREFKRDAYLALEVRQVWLIDLSDRNVEVWRGAGESEIVREVVRW